MSKALELAGELEDKVENPFKYSLETMANAASELRRLAQIERKYNQIMAQLPVVYLTNGSNGGWEIWDADSSDINPVPVYTLPKD